MAAFSKNKVLKTFIYIFSFFVYTSVSVSLIHANNSSSDPKQDIQNVDQSPTASDAVVSPNNEEPAPAEEEQEER